MKCPGLAVRALTALRGALVLGTARTKEKAAAACATFPGKAIGSPVSSQTLRRCEGASQRSRQTVTGSTPSSATRAS
jgi:hypothetical protein